MANGRAIGRFEAALGVVGLLALGVTYSITTGWNPLPGVQNWLNRSQTLAEPAPAWTVRTGDQPTWAAGTATARLPRRRPDRDRGHHGRYPPSRVPHHADHLGGRRRRPGARLARRLPPRGLHTERRGARPGRRPVGLAAARVRHAHRERHRLRPAHEPGRR